MNPLKLDRAKTHMTDVIPLYGIPPLIFGMSRSQAIATAGQPDTTRIQNNETTGQTEVWEYISAQVEIDFSSEDDWRLSSITVRSKNSTVKGLALIGCEAHELAGKAMAVGINDIQQTDDFEENGKCHQSDAAGLMFWEIDGQIVNLTMSPAYDESGNIPLWPID